MDKKRIKELLDYHPHNSKGGWKLDKTNQRICDVQVSSDMRSAKGNTVVNQRRNCPLRDKRRMSVCLQGLL